MGKPGEGNQSEDPDLDERIILRWIFSKWAGGLAWTAFIWLRIGTGDGFL